MASCGRWKFLYHAKLPTAGQVPEFVQVLSETLHFSSVQGCNLRPLLLPCVFPPLNRGYAWVPPALAAGTEEGNLSKSASLLARKIASSLGSRYQTNNCGATESQDLLPVA